MRFAVPVYVSKRLRVMTYNIHAAKGVDRRIDLDRIGQVIQSYAPDIVALQEVDVGRARSGEIDQADELAKTLGMTAVFAPCIDDGSGRYGIATLTRLPVLESRQLCLPIVGHRRSQPRCALVTRHTWDDGEVEVINTHLSILFRERPGQIAAIAAEMLGEALVIAGDFNCTPFSPAYKVLKRRGMRSATRFARTWPSPAPVVPIDHIFFRGRLDVVSSGAWTDGPARRASDHLPVVAELQHIEIEAAA
jgi:endonuclease/exonuclease/phosphatase family metal-dependent hydrolase